MSLIYSSSPMYFWFNKSLWGHIYYFEFGFRIRIIVFFFNLQHLFQFWDNTLSNCRIVMLLMQIQWQFGILLRHLLKKQQHIFLNNKSIITNTRCEIETFNKMCLELNLEMKTLERSRNCHNNNANFIIWQMKMNPKNDDEMCQNKQNKFQEKWEGN